MDLDRMLDKCRRGQWRPEDIDWSRPPRPMSRAQERAVVQYFTDMAAIERLAEALFVEQQKRVQDPLLKKIYATFVADEARHALVADRLARHYDLHGLQQYRESPGLTAFRPAFLAALHYLSDEVANAYVTGGELMLDIALLRSLNDYVDDVTSSAAMELINRDESRHIAIDFHMVEFYTSDAYQASVSARPSAPPLDWIKGTFAFMRLLRAGGPFFMQIFFEPMAVADPSGRRLREAVKRIQLLQNMPGIGRNPLQRFGLFLRDVYQHPVYGTLFGGAVERLVGLPADLVRNLYTAEEGERARARGFSWLAEEALGLKTAA